MVLTTINFFVPNDNRSKAQCGLIVPKMLFNPNHPANQPTSTLSMLLLVC